MTAEERDGKRVYTITDAGRAELEERRAARGGTQEPWEFGPMGEGLAQFRDAAFQLGAAAMQVARTGTEAQRDQGGRDPGGGAEEDLRAPRRGLTSSRRRRVGGVDRRSRAGARRASLRSLHSFSDDRPEGARMPKGILERLAEGPVLGDGGYLLELEKRGYVQAGPFTPGGQ